MPICVHQPSKGTESSAPISNKTIEHDSWKANQNKQTNNVAAITAASIKLYFYLFKIRLDRRKIRLDRRSVLQTAASELP
jgi:hypothetical protein